jgi:hypothetical protein
LLCVHGLNETPLFCCSLSSSLTELFYVQIRIEKTWLPVAAMSLMVTLTQGLVLAWLYRSYKNAYIWRDLTEKDVILPLQGSKEYVLKASELRLDAYRGIYIATSSSSTTDISYACFA